MKITYSTDHLRLTYPKDMVSIAWEVDGRSGSTQCECWRLQYEIERLEAAGYAVKGVSRA